MIAFLRRFLQTRHAKIDSLQRALDAVRTERDNWRKQYKTVSRQYDDLSERQATANRIAMVLSRETYETKVLRHIGNTTVTQQDTEHSTAFKLGIQHALRHIEQECVAQ